MSSVQETAAIVALLRAAGRPWHEYSEAIEQQASALAVLEQEHGLLAPELMARELDEATAWHAAGAQPVTVLDDDYPENLRGVHDRPPLVFVAGSYLASDARAVAVIGSRVAGEPGRRAAGVLAEHLVGAGYTVVSGLARGIDHAAHTRALAAGGRTIAVIGTGLRHSYPPEHAELQRRIAAAGAVVSQFWPDSPPTRHSFPLRNAVMSGLSQATVIVEATHTSGARIQARRALAHGRPVFLRRTLLEQAWARELAARPGTYVVTSPGEITEALSRLAATGALTG